MDTDEVLIPVSEKLTFEEAKTLLVSMRDHAFTFYFGLETFFYADYNIFENRSKAIDELSVLKEGSTPSVSEIIEELIQSISSLPECWDEVPD